MDVRTEDSPVTCVVPAPLESPLKSHVQHCTFIPAQARARRQVTGCLHCTVAKPVGRDSQTSAGVDVVVSGGNIE